MLDSPRRRGVPINITAQLREVARRDPDAPAVIAGSSIEGVAEGRVFTYGEFDRIVDTIGMLALARGLRPGDHVSLLLRPHLPLLAVKLAFARVGIVSCSADLVAGASARVVMRGNGTFGDGQTVVVDPAWWSPQATTPPAPMHPGGDAMYALQATSGTTGVPKSVAVPHATTLARVRLLTDYLGPTPRRSLCISGPGSGVGIHTALQAFEAGGALILPPSSNDVASLLVRHQVNRLVSSPFGISRVLEHHAAEAPRIASLQQITLSGAHLPAALVRSVEDRLCENVFCLYGATETGPVAGGRGGELDGRDGAVGKPLPGCVIEVVDAAGNALPRGATGTIRIFAPTMEHEYFRDPAATARAFRDGWYLPGDVGTITGGGIVVIVGREDDLINVGGSKIAPEAIEDVLKRVPGVTDAAAFGVPDGLGKQVVHAAIVAVGAVDVAAIQDTFRAHKGIPPPSVVLRMPELPRDAHGKLRREALAQFARSMPR